jgi:NADH dehydrogenase
MRRSRVIIIGCGFGGLAAARGLGNAPVDVLVIDRNNYHTFQPLLYQVASAALTPAEIAMPIRSILRKQKNAAVKLGEVSRVDLAAQAVVVGGDVQPFDYLVLAAGATDNYFGHAEWHRIAPGLKTIEDAVEIRAKVLLSYEAAEIEQDPAARAAKLTFVVIGGGPTGVETAGAIKELAVDSLVEDFRYIDTRRTRVVLVEAADRLLPGMHPESSRRARRDLLEMGVDVVVGEKVTEIREDGIQLGDRFIRSDNVIWAAGVQASPLTAGLGVPLGPGGRVLVEPDLSIPGYANAFAVGDLAHVTDPASGKIVPGVAQGALQMGRYVARLIEREVAGRHDARTKPFTYRDKGTMATIGRSRAVAEVGRFRFYGIVGWLLWSLVHVLFLIGFRNRLITLFSWIESYVFFRRGSRLILGEDLFERLRPVERGPDP